MFNVRARTIYLQYMIQTGADLTIILGLGFVRAFCSVIEESRTFFMGAIIYRTMEKPKNDTIKTVVRSMRRQTICENFIVLQSVASDLNLRLDFEEVEFDDGDLFCFPILLHQIYSTQIYKNILYMLCDNFVLHIVNLVNKYHWIRVLEKQLSFGCLVFWIFKLKVSCGATRLTKIYHQYQKYMKKKNTPSDKSEELLAHLKAIPEPTQAIDEETSDLIVGILQGMKTENPLGLKQEESIIELEIQAGKFICLLDEKWDLKRLFRVNDEGEKTTRLK